MVRFHCSLPKCPGVGMGPPYTTSPDVPVSRPSLKLLLTKGSIIPVETEEEGLLRREYVLVGDTQAVEFNRVVDGAPFTLGASAFCLETGWPGGTGSTGNFVPVTSQIVSRVLDVGFFARPSTFCQMTLSKKESCTKVTKNCMKS